jgi:predicted 2-oxoglutarate/Fe(II)-dependent dioxygenase YbiX
MVDLVELPDVLDPPEREALLVELRALAGDAARVFGQMAGGTVDARVRRATRLAVAPETRERVRRRLLDRKGELEARFGVTLADCEPPQFLRYETGDFFVAHQDGNTPLLHDDTRFRKVSVVLFLRAPSEEPTPDTYGGGALVFHGPPNGPPLRVPVTPPPGTLVGFRAETTHEVVPVTHGERYTVVAWFR